MKDPSCVAFVRRLHPWEVQEARRVFGDTLRYEQIRIHECAGWTNSLSIFTARLRRTPYSGIDNAVTLGNHCYFPVRMPQLLPLPGQAQFSRLPWLIHELTHCWQYQHLGWRYFIRAISVQIRRGPKAYIYGGVNTLEQSHLQGFRFSDFNLEQQGEITRDFYHRLVRGEDVSAYQPFITQLQQVA